MMYKHRQATARKNHIASNRQCRSWKAILTLAGLLCIAATCVSCRITNANSAQTTVSIVGDDFYINGAPTYPGRFWNGHRVEGLLLNSRMVQGIFDDNNAETVSRWEYPDTHKWNADRNTNEFIASMPEWRRHGLLAFTINLQGGSPYGYSQSQPWINSAIAPDGSLKPEYLSRLDRIIRCADRLGMVVILGYFYFGQADKLTDEQAVLRASDNATKWLFDQGYKNVIVEIDNECNLSYTYGPLKAEGIASLISRVKEMHRGKQRMLVGTSYQGGSIPGEDVARASDFILLHGNGVGNPSGITDMITRTRALPGWTPKPILFNEDDHFAFDQPNNNLTAAVEAHASWGFFDYRMKGEGFDYGFQSVPVNWGISSPLKEAFFNMIALITGAASVPSPAPSTGVTR